MEGRPVLCSRIRADCCHWRRGDCGVRRFPSSIRSVDDGCLASRRSACEWEESGGVTHVVGQTNNLIVLFAILIGLRGQFIVKRVDFSIGTRCNSQNSTVDLLRTSLLT